VDVQLNADHAGQVSLGKPGVITGGFTLTSPGVSVSATIQHLLISVNTENTPSLIQELQVNGTI
jgi:hypothetical protein